MKCECAKLVEEMLHMQPWKDNPWAQTALTLAAQAIRRGRHLTGAERLANIEAALAQDSVGPFDNNDPRPIWEQGLAMIADEDEAAEREFRPTRSLATPPSEAPSKEEVAGVVILAHTVLDLLGKTPGGSDEV